MKFEEKADLTIDATRNYLIYFLIKDEEVVYVGQTTQNLIRPFSHKDKEFDTVKIIYQEENKDLLNQNEEFYIKKYSPKYNKVFNADGYSDDLMNRIYQVNKLKTLTQYYMNRDELNKELDNYKVKPLSRKEYKALKKHNFYFYNKLVLMDPDSLLRLVTYRISPKNTRMIPLTKKKSFENSIDELLKTFTYEGK